MKGQNLSGECRRRREALLTERVHTRADQACCRANTRADHACCRANTRAGPLPDTWGGPGAFPGLEDLALENNSLAGPLPEGWGQPGSFPRVWRMCVCC